MKISRTVLNDAAALNIINTKQSEELHQFIQKQDDQTPTFNLTNVLYYLGGLIAIGAMSLFMNLSWESYGGWGIFCLSLVYGFLGLALTAKFQEKSYIIPAGICATFVICLTPLAIYGFQKGMGWWPDNSTYQDYHFYIKWLWIYMELGTLIVGLILAWKYRYPFMIMPIAFTLWYMSMDVAAMITNQQPDYQFSAFISMYFGLAVILIAFWVDIRSRHTLDYAFWLYLFGVLAFWGGMTAQNSPYELSKFIYLCINLLLIGIGVILYRKVFVIFGAIGTFLYLGHLAFQVFKDSLYFPTVLILIGLLIIWLGILWHKHRFAITQKIIPVLPAPLRELLEIRHG